MLTKVSLRAIFQTKNVLFIYEDFTFIKGKITSGQYVKKVHCHYTTRWDQLEAKTHNYLAKHKLLSDNLPYHDANIICRVEYETKGKPTLKQRWEHLIGADE